MQPDWTAARREADAIVADWPADAPGGALLLFDRDGTRHEAASGLADLPHRIPFTAATPTRYASITKHVFCAFGLRQGLDLQQPLGALLPDLPAPIAAVPVFRALAMTGGIPDLMQTYMLCGVPHTAALDGAVLDAFTRRLPGLDFAPGTELSYSNTGYRLVEEGLARGGAAFSAWVEGPLNAALSTGFGFPTSWDRPVRSLATGYWREGPEAPWRAGAYGMALSASGALTGSARDLAAWLRALLRGDGPARDVLERLSAPSPMADGTLTGYGLGLALMEMAGRRFIGHGGHLTGYKNHFLLDPALGAGVVLLSNREETEPLFPAVRVMAALLGAVLPARLAPGTLPEGLFVEADGPAWIEHRGGILTFLNAAQPLYAGASAGEAVSLSPYLRIRLARDGDGIAGEIGHVARRFHPVPPEVALPAAMEGRWRSEAMGVEITLAIGPDGAGTAAMGAGPLHRRVALTPLGGGRALMPVGAPPWPGRACLWLRAPDTLRLVTNRSRVLDFRRV